VKERNQYHVVTHHLALHIETVNLPDGEYKLVPADSCVDQEVSLPDNAQEGKLRCINPLFLELLVI